MDLKLDRRKKLTRLLLKESLLKRMQEKPLSRITIKEVCDLADINRSTFYFHYNDLYDLLNQIEDEFIGSMNETLSSYNYSKDEEALQMTEKLLEYIREKRESCQILFSEHGNPTFQKKVMMFAQMHLLKSLESHSNSLPYNPEYLSLYIVNGSILVIQTWLKNGLQESPKEMAELINIMATKGISSLK